MSTPTTKPVAPLLRKPKAAAPTKQAPVIRGSAAPATEVKLVDPSKVKTRQPLPADKPKTE